MNCQIINVTYNSWRSLNELKTKNVISRRVPIEFKSCLFSFKKSNHLLMAKRFYSGNISTPSFVKNLPIGLLNPGILLYIYMVVAKDLYVMSFLENYERSLSRPKFQYLFMYTSRRRRIVNALVLLHFFFNPHGYMLVDFVYITHIRKKSIFVHFCVIRRIYLAKKKK